LRSSNPQPKKPASVRRRARRAPAPLTIAGCPSNVQSECTIDARSTLLLRHLSADDRRYVTLDDLAVRDLARRDPVLFLQKYRTPILIDEIQYAPELRFMRTAVSLNRDSRQPSAVSLNPEPSVLR
jgi:hypothetical protein